jgi:hypothetical protein
MPFSSDPNQTTDLSLGFFDRRECIEMNLSFAKALIAARKRGDESEKNVSYGPRPDHTVIYPTHFPRNPTQSLMSSSGATCLDCAMGGEMPGRLIPTPDSRGRK